MTPVITIDRISKRYRIAHTSPARYRTFRDELGGALGAAFRRFTAGKLDGREDFWALTDVSFEVNQGDVVGIIGKNGSGKSTLLKILSRITDPTKGQATICGRLASLLEVGTGFHPELTGRENIYFNGSILGMPRAEISRKFDEIVEFAEVEQFLDTSVKFFSSGMYVRLAFAVAAHLEPDILIVDEVLAVGDSQFQKKCLGRMEDISKEGRTVLFVSHNMGAVRQLCTKGVLLANGHSEYFHNIKHAVGAYQASTASMSADNSEVSVRGKTIKFLDIRVGGSHISEQREVFSGDPLEVSLQYLDSTDHGYDLCLGLALRSTADSSLLVYTHSHLEDVRYRTSIKGTAKVKLMVPRLSPGTYSLELNAWLNGEHLVYEEPIGDLLVVGVPTFVSNTTFTSFPSALMVDSTWEFA